MSAGRVCSRVVVTATPGESVHTAARRMADNDVGMLVVIESDGRHRAIGIVTDRDIVVRCLAGRLDPEETTVSQVMTTPVLSVNEHTPIEQALKRMAKGSTRRLVVTGVEGRPVGLLSIDDVLGLIGTEFGSIATLLDHQQPHLQVEHELTVG